MNSLALSRFLVIVSITIFFNWNLVWGYEVAMARRTQIRSLNFIKTSCSVTLYPRLCFKSLQVFSSTINSSPRRLSHTALAVSRFHVNRTIESISKLPKIPLSEREEAAIGDCLDNLGDSLDQIENSMRELRVLGSKNLMFQINNIQTWVSAALTDQDTCNDSLESVNGNLRFELKRMMRKLERLTSNSLAIFNSFAANITEGRLY